MAKKINRLLEVWIMEGTTKPRQINTFEDVEDREDIYKYLSKLANRSTEQTRIRVIQGKDVIIDIQVPSASRRNKLLNAAQLSVPSTTGVKNTKRKVAARKNKKRSSSAKKQAV